MLPSVRQTTGETPVPRPLQRNRPKTNPSRCHGGSATSPAASAWTTRPRCNSGRLSTTPRRPALFLETNLPDPSDTRRFLPAATAKVEHYLRHTHGGAFVLFTSYAMLRQMAETLRPTLEHLGMPVLVQGHDLTPRQLLKRFRELDDAVLFGTSSFWQGIDVQGHKLRNVIIVKLPFSVPDEPIVEARHEHITRTGGNPFMDLSLPEAIIRLKQGFGRLIRSKTDKGIVVILDSRVKTKRYGKQFLDALPDVKVVEVVD